VATVNLFAVSQSLGANNDAVKTISYSFILFIYVWHFNIGRKIPEPGQHIFSQNIRITNSLETAKIYLPLNVRYYYVSVTDFKLLIYFPLFTKVVVV
jgi:hypothetical protein